MNQKLHSLDTFIVICVLTILGIRAFLEATGYPQIGSNGLHVAHMLWGGVAMTIVILYLLLSNAPNRIFAALLGGVGFGFFIDEIGKFVTSDNNYFYEGTALLIYLTIIGIWFTTRVLIVKSHKGSFFTPAEWPRNRLSRLSILLYAALSAVAGGLFVVGEIFSPGSNVAGISTSAYDIFPTITVALSLAYAIGVYFYYKGDLLKSASIIRNALLLSALLVTPFTFYNEKFAAITGTAVQILIMLALSEASLKNIVRPIFTKQAWTPLLKN